MAINLLGRVAAFEEGDEERDEDAEKLDIPIHAFDCVIADECHRGYTSAEISTWRTVLDHFDAVKIGLTATPAAHTAAYFKDVVYRYEYERAGGATGPCAGTALGTSRAGAACCCAIVGRFSIEPKATPTRIRARIT
jgi:hypothetical protein